MPAQTTTHYDHRTTFILNLLASNSPQALAQAARLVPYKVLPPAKDTAYGARELMDRVANRDLPTKFEKMVALAVRPRPHGRVNAVGTRWTACPCPRLDEIRVGRTVRQMMCRGVTEADIRDAVRLGWLTLGDKT